MLNEQDELLRLSVRQRPNKQRVDRTQDRSSRADGECQRKDRNGCKAPLLEQLTQGESKIFKHSQSKARRFRNSLGIFVIAHVRLELDRRASRARRAKNTQLKKRAGSLPMPIRTQAGHAGSPCKANCPSTV